MFSKLDISEYVLDLEKAYICKSERAWEGDLGAAWCNVCNASDPYILYGSKKIYEGGL